MKYDFLIIGLPRSGTHMVASALNSHPEIQCRNEDPMPLYGHCTGRVFTRIDDLPIADKHIVITRPYEDRLRSWQTSGTAHSQHPWTPQAGHARHDRLADDHHRLMSFSRHVNAMVVAYDHLTGGTDTRCFPEELSRRICDYLDVDLLPLRPKTHKARDMVSKP